MTASPGVVRDLETLVAHGSLSRLDQHFALTLARLAPGTPDAVVLAAALASRAIGQGHVAADLASLSQTPFRDREGHPVSDVAVPSLDEFLRTLGESPLCGARAAAARPLVLDAAGRVYLTRYAAYQERLAEGLRRRTGHAPGGIDGRLLREGLRRLFPRPRKADDARENAAEDRQRQAALLAVLQRLTVICGGPGTGKTFTVAKILALLQEQALGAGRPPLGIKLLAPTGKAAQRLAESIELVLAQLSLRDEVRRAVTTEASTLHRALGYLPHAPTRFRHDADNPLVADVVLVDEASMVDLALMAKLVDAVPRQARLILMGDKDQLASVEAGAILGDIHGRQSHEGYSIDLVDRARSLGEALPEWRSRPFPGIHDALITLTESHRYASTSGVGVLARAINAGDADGALAALRDRDDVTLWPLSQLESVLGPVVLETWGELGGTADLDLQALARLRILSPIRRGPHGVDALVAFVEATLSRAGLAVSPQHYVGRPIMVTANDYEVDLFNGDVGVIAESAEPRARPRPALEAVFPSRLGLRRVPTARLPEHETVFAMTVHKSQGSEFDRVALLIPEDASATLTRELIYTAVTRARRRVDIFGSPDSLSRGIDARISRSSGLEDALWNATLGHAR
jgi:exodeoxyribonuclease V alpha subunit